MKKGWRRGLVVGVVTIFGVSLVAWFSFPLWDGFGPWMDLPQEESPRSSTVFDDRFVHAAEEAFGALVAHQEDHGFPAITSAVSIDGHLVWGGAVGWAELESRKPASLTTLFRIGSTSKAVTATALARLVDEGEMSLDAPLSTYSGDWPNPHWNGLTIRRLGSHTAGLPEYEGNRDWAGAFMTLCGCRHYSGVWESLEIFDGAPLEFERGSDFLYSSFDVNLIGAAMSASQGEPFLGVLDRMVFQPLGITDMGGDGDGMDRPELATFYETDGHRARIWRDFDLSQRWPSGGLVATSVDLVRIGGAWMDSTFISPETREEMWTPQTLNNGEVNEQSYAIGWRFYPDALWPGDSTKVLPYAHHGGVSKGSMSWLVVYPAYRLSIAVNMNTRAATFGEFSSVEDLIASGFLARIQELEGGPGKVEDWEG